MEVTIDRIFAKDWIMREALGLSSSIYAYVKPLPSDLTSFEFKLKARHLMMGNGH